MKDIIYKLIKIFEEKDILVKDIRFDFEQGGIYLLITYAYHNKRVQMMHYVAGGVLCTQNADRSNLDVELEYEIENVIEKFNKEQK